MSDAGDLFQNGWTNPTVFFWNRGYPPPVLQRQCYKGLEHNFKNLSTDTERRAVSAIAGLIVRKLYKLCNVLLQRNYRETPKI